VENGKHHTRKPSRQALKGMGRLSPVTLASGLRVQRARKGERGMNSRACLRRSAVYHPPPPIICHYCYIYCSVQSGSMASLLDPEGMLKMERGQKRTLNPRSKRNSSP
jgi:hypothetical protein